MTYADARRLGIGDYVLIHTQRSHFQPGQTVGQRWSV
jgi:hypothetical protein